MGRPIPRKMFGPVDTSTPASGSIWSADGKDPQGRTLTAQALAADQGYNIPVYKARIVGGAVDVGGVADQNVFIIAQKGANKFKVRTDDGDGVCKLVNDDLSSNIDEGEMVLQGFVGGENNPVFIAKLTRRLAVDFSGNRYKWVVVNDSTSNYISLTAI